MTTFKPGDRVQWLGFVRRNIGEPDRPIGTLGTVHSNLVGIPSVIWDGGNGTIHGEPYSGSTWAENLAPAPTGDPATQDLRERLIAQAAKVADFGATPQSIVEAAQAFEAYITGGTK